ncbi:YjbE family putative metal transport protein [Alphaproteobacteria bacterium]|jgi:YjbE family integral membrane protein|nr:YjbE family putative metal transport protein [Alphaproteobacteria bacterium]MDB9871758.1 YjbE family putative metal transport protein [Alphaproteobacteria bacterium]|tara:strand:+ start:7615 stop:8220 length:606 start_codon:yes stop_codon:yes gene_type:complete
MDFILDISQIILADVILSGDNALVIGMAASQFEIKLRKKIIFYGLLIAAILRILLASIASYLISIPGILILGGFLLFWVSWVFYKDIKNFTEEDIANNELNNIKSNKKNFKKALITIAIADLSMSLDNIVAITAIARDNTALLIFGLVLSILIMAVFATAIIKLLIKYKWISYIGLIFLVYLSFDMTIDGFLNFYSWSLTL